MIQLGSVAVGKKLSFSALQDLIKYFQREAATAEEGRKVTLESLEEKSLGNSETDRNVWPLQSIYSKIE